MVFDMTFGAAEQNRQQQLRALLDERERIRKTLQTCGASKNGPLQTSPLKQYNQVQAQIKALRGL